jgi:hypothetical protein
MRLRIALAAFAAAFGVATALAALTTVKHVGSHTTSLSQPISRIQG